MLDVAKGYLFTKLPVDAESALAEAERTFTLLDAMEDRCKSAHALGRILIDLDRKRSHSWLLLAIDLAEKIASSPMLIDVCATMSALQQSDANDPQSKQKAIAYLERAVTLARHIGSFSTTANLDMQLASVYRDDGQYDLAQEAAERAIEYYKATHLAHNYGSALRELAQILALNDRLPKAQTAFKSAIEQFLKIGDWQCSSLTYTKWAQAEANHSNYDHALTLLGEAGKACKASGYVEGEIAVLNNTADVYRKTRQWTLAEAAYRQILEQAHDQGDEAVEAETLNYPSPTI